MTAEAVRSFHTRWYRPANVVVAAAGALDHAEVVEGIAKRLPPDLVGGDTPSRRAPGAPLRPFVAAKRRAEQAHLAIGVRGLHRSDPDRYALAVANQVLGDGTSSRLFTTVREERGLAYTVYSSPSSYSDAGSLVLYAGTAPDRAAEVLGLLHGALDELATTPVDPEELAVATGYLAGSTVLGLEDTGSRMERLGWSTLMEDRITPIDELLDRYRSVTVDDVARVSRRLLDGTARAVAALGPLSKRDLGAGRAA
jgi:predicted Zn-dependent peptidase